MQTGRSKVHSLGGHSFSYSMFLRNRPASKMEGFQPNSREVAQMAGRQIVGNMHVKRSDPKKQFELCFPQNKCNVFSVCFLVGVVDHNFLVF